MSVFVLLSQFLQKPKEVGSVIPSSKALVDAMLAPINWGSTTVIVEFGPGTGVITKEILKRMGGGKLIAFEINTLFYSQLSNLADPRLQVRMESALSLDLTTNVIISSLPLTNFSSLQTRSILSVVAAHLTVDGKFIQFQYTPKQESLLKEYFDVVERQIIALNVPPAFVYVCSGKK